MFEEILKNDGVTFKLFVFWSLDFQLEKKLKNPKEFLF